MEVEKKKRRRREDETKGKCHSVSESSLENAIQGKDTLPG
jgi:hypothetical protein